MYNDGSCEYDPSDCIETEGFDSETMFDENEEEYLLVKSFSPPLSQTIQIKSLSNSIVKVVDISGKVIFNELVSEGAQFVVPTETKGIFLIIATKEEDGMTQTTKLYVH